MSIKFNLATAAIAIALASLSTQGSAVARANCNGTVYHYAHTSWQCYYLPTVANGRVTGLQRHINFSGNGYPHGRYR